MHVGDVQTITLKKQPGGGFLKSWEYGWLEYIGYTVKELKELDEVTIVLKAEVSEHKKHKYIGFGRAR